jgi:cytochrome c-type biogenesis protein CcmF
VAGRTDNRWLADVRRWLIFSWVFLTAGIVLGAWWAYVELGWGGYWAWDPVENASLLPWLTATALMHSIMAQQHRGMLKLWNASLIGLTFLLCILGTYLTRSGVVSSVHAFAPSLIGTFFLAFLTLSTATTAGLIIWRRRALRSEVAMDGLLSREGAFLLANLLLLLITLTILVGTVFPILSGLFTDEPITVQPTFYNRVVAPMGVLLVAIMAAGPVLSFGKDAARTLGRRLLVPAIVAVAVTAVVWWSGITSFWMLLCVAIATIGTGAVIIDLARSLAARRRSTGEGWVTAGVQLIDHDHRRYGGQLAHLGVMMLVIGVAGSSLFSRDTVVRLHPGEDARLGGYTITLVSLDEVRDVNFTAVQATVKLTEPGGLVRHLRPQRRFYDTWREPNTEIAVRSNLRDDVYVSLAGWERGGAIAAIQVRMNPLVMWIWIGGIVMSVGGVLCVLPRLLPQARRAEAVEPAEAVATAKGSREPRAEPVLTPATKVEVSS